MRAGSNVQIQNKLYSNSIQQTAPHVLRLKNVSKPKNVRPWEKHLCLIKAKHTAAEFTSHHNTASWTPRPHPSLPPQCQDTVLYTHSHSFLELPIKEQLFYIAVLTEQPINSWLKVTQNIFKGLQANTHTNVTREQGHYNFSIFKFPLILVLILLLYIGKQVILNPRLYTLPRLGLHISTEQNCSHLFKIRWLKRSNIPTEFMFHFIPSKSSIWG